MSETKKETIQNVDSLIGKQKTSIDSRIREIQKKKDLEEESKLRQGMEQEEEEIRSMFEEMEKPIKEDPTLVRKRQYQEKMATYKSVLADVQLKNLYSQLKNFRGNTIEEQETLIDCKYFVKRRCLEGISLCTLASSLFSFYNRRYITKSAVFGGVVVGIITGSMLGFLRSTQYILQRFEQLGPEFYLGRMALQEISDYRMDVVRKKA